MMSPRSESSPSVSKLFKVKEVANLLAVSEATVRRRLRSGELRATFVGRLVRVSDRELERFLGSPRRRFNRFTAKPRNP